MCTYRTRPAPATVAYFDTPFDAEKCQRAHWARGHKLKCQEADAERSNADPKEQVPETWESLLKILTEPSAGAAGIATPGTAAQRPHIGDCVAAAVTVQPVESLVEGASRSAEERKREKARRGREQREMKAARTKEGLLRSLKLGQAKIRGEKELLKEKSVQVIQMQYDVRSWSPGVLGFNGTGFALVSANPGIYLLILLCFGVWALKNFHSCQWQMYDERCRPAAEWMTDNAIPSSALHVIAGISIFTTCLFYFETCYRQYEDYFRRVTNTTELIDDMSFVLQMYFSQKSTKWNALRYILAAHAFLYWDLQRRSIRWNLANRNTPDFGGFSQQLIEQGLLLKVEVDALEQKDNEARISSLMSWCIKGDDRSTIIHA
jgi:hypothetical protein